MIPYKFLVFLYNICLALSCVDFVQFVYCVFSIRCWMCRSMNWKLLTRSSKRLMHSCSRYIPSNQKISWWLSAYTRYRTCSYVHVVCICKFCNITIFQLEKSELTNSNIFVSIRYANKCNLKKWNLLIENIDQATSICAHDTRCIHAR